MHIGVTGSSGKLGSAVVRDLATAGHHVVGFDRKKPARDAPGHHVQLNLSDAGAVLDAISGVEERAPRFDAIVHLAAIPAPGLVGDLATFRNNMPASHAVLQACRRAGVRRIVTASSETTLGLPFDVPPVEVPVHEGLELRPESTYSMVKAMEELMEQTFCRWDPELAITALRFSNVMAPEDYAAFPSFDGDPMIRKWNLWGYVDARDAAQAVRLAVEKRTSGFEAYIVANADTVMSRSSASLMAEVFPEVPITRELGEHETLLSIDKARRELGYEPQYSWRDQV